MRSASARCYAHPRSTPYSLTDAHPSCDRHYRVLFSRRRLHEQNFHFGQIFWREWEVKLINGCVFNLDNSLIGNIINRRKI